MILRATTDTKGGSGPSGMNADGWRRVLASSQFGTASLDLRKTFAEMIKNNNCALNKLVQTWMVPHQLSPLLHVD